MTLFYILTTLLLVKVAHGGVLVQDASKASAAESINATGKTSSNETASAGNRVVVIAPKNATISARDEANITMTPGAKFVRSRQESSFCQTTLTTAINDFSFELANQLQTKDTNLLISPLGVASVLAMTYHGAGGNTAKQLQQALHFQKHNLKDQNVTKEFGEIYDLISPETSSNYTLKVANGMFLQEKYEILASYDTAAEDTFQGTVENLDFAKDPKSSLSEINSWVASNTKDGIPKLFDTLPADHNNVMLLSAAYFKGKWRHQFPVNGTREDIFHRHDNTTKKVPMMSIRGQKFRFLDCNKTHHKFIELPYMGNNIAMLLALPHDLKTPDLVMTSELLCNVCNSMLSTELTVLTLPKFKLAHQSELHKSLVAMGISDLFGISANLTGISKVNGLHVDSVVHKSAIEVNEEGGNLSEVKGDALAAISNKGATTSNMAATTSNSSNSSSSSSLSASFEANRPFLLHIVDKRNGGLLFSGRVADPSNSVQTSIEIRI